MSKTNLSKKQKYLIFSLKNNFSGLLFSLLILLIMILIISSPKLFSNATISGLKLFFYSVLPGLFPFMLLTKLLTEIGFVYKLSNKLSPISQKLFGTPGVSLYVLLMSILSGYPIGAKIIFDFYQNNQITEADAKKLSIFCTTSGPIFIIGAVGVSMLSNYKVGLIIYFSHIFSSILLGIIYNLITKNKHKYYKRIVIISKPNTNIISKCLIDTINSLFVVAGFITAFYLISEILVYLKIITFISNAIYPIISKLGISKSETEGLLFGIIEVTRGCKTLSALVPANIPAICGLISFSGISIIMQSMTFLKPAKIKTHTFILFKCVHCIFSVLICKLFVFIII